MICVTCKYENRAEAGFCGRCGRSLQPQVLCSSCNSANSESHQFCDICGTQLDASTRLDVGIPQTPGVEDKQAWPFLLRVGMAPGAKAFFSQPRNFRLLLVAGATVATVGQLILVGIATSTGPPAPGVVGLALGVALFALGSIYSAGYGNEIGSFQNVKSPKKVFGGYRAEILAVAGLSVYLALLYRLARGSTSGWDLALWLLAILLLAVPFLRRIQLPRIESVRKYRVDILIPIALVGLFVALTIHDLEGWYYSAIGDEYSFYLGAKDILDHGLTRPFSQAGVYDKQPVLNSAYQALVMAIFGQNNFGWRLASVISVAAAIPGIYLVGRVLGDRRVALVSSVLFTFSHYMFAYAHTGYNNIHPLAPTVWALGLFALGLRTKTPILLYVSGLIAGLGFYTLFAARAIIPIMFLWVLTLPERRRHLLSLWPLGLGFVLVAIPIFAVSRGDIFSKMLVEIPGGYSEAVTGPVSERLVTNLLRNFLAFNFNSDVFHYVSGSLLDPATAVIAALGIGLALGNLRGARLRLVLIWTLVAVVATGLLSPHPQVAISRLNFVVPALTLLAGFAAVHLWDNARWVIPRVSRRWVGSGVLVALSLTVLALNIQRFWFDTPGVFHLTQEAAAIGAMRSEACGEDLERIVLLGRETEPLLKPALNSYYPDGKTPVLLDHKDLESGQPFQIGAARCVIFVNPTDDKAQKVLEDLSRRHPNGRVLDFSDPAEKAMVKIFTPSPG